MAHILVVDDDTMLAEMLVKHIERAGYQATAVSSLNKGVEQVCNGIFDVVFLDVQLPDGNGLEAFSLFSKAPSKPEVIIMTGAGSPDGAKMAIKAGAWSYLEKPHVLRNLLLPLTRALQYREEKKRIRALPVALKRDSIIGKSPGLMQCLDQLAKVAVSEASVLLTGETGTGKEVFARAIHDNSNRSNQPFVVVDCASLPETLIESTLFGHVKGAFTGANRTTPGLIKMADGGTLFLDEVGELPERIQKTFLRVLQERRFRPVGGMVEESSDFRVIAATNRDLDQSANQDRFRSDLLYRLRSFSLHLPPLRERMEDVRPLVRYFLIRLCDRTRVSSKGIADELYDHLLAYEWPGNVRELQQTVEQMFANAFHYPTLYACHLPEHLRVRQTLEGMKREPMLTSVSTQLPSGPLTSWKTYKAAIEATYFQQLLAVSKGNIKEMGRISGLSRARLYQLLNLYADHFPQHLPGESWRDVCFESDLQTTASDVSRPRGALAAAPATTQFFGPAPPAPVPLILDTEAGLCNSGDKPRPAPGGLTLHW
jgi:two-component system NtrC family response regulator